MKGFYLSGFVPLEGLSATFVAEGIELEGNPVVRQSGFDLFVRFFALALPLSLERAFQSRCSACFSVGGLLLKN